MPFLLATVARCSAADDGPGVIAFEEAFLTTEPRVRLLEQLEESRGRFRRPNCIDWFRTLGKNNSCPLRTKGLVMLVPRTERRRRQTYLPPYPPSIPRPRMTTMGGRRTYDRRVGVPLLFRHFQPPLGDLSRSVGPQGHSNR